MTRWEYRIEEEVSLATFPSCNLIGKLQEYGQDGWELAGVVDGWVVFKRPIPVVGRLPDVPKGESAGGSQ